MTTAVSGNKPTAVHRLFDLEELCGRPGGGYGPWARVGGLPPGKTDPERGFEHGFRRICSPKNRDRFLVLAWEAGAHFSAKSV